MMTARSRPFAGSFLLGLPYRVSMASLTFLIPVRHPSNSADWSQLKANLAQTIRSVAAQTSDDWQAIIIANHGSDLPPLPARFTVEWVDFPPNPRHEKGNLSTEEFLDAFRIDKGRRVLKGMLRARDSRFFMIVDDDDFVSARLAEFVAGHPDAHGWIVDVGYVWTDGGSLLYRHPHLNRVCGTTLVVRSDLYDLPATFESATPEFIKSMLGAHIFTAAALAERGTPLASLPFAGAIYRVGHSGAHSQNPPILKRYVFNETMIRRPRELVKHLRRLRLLDSAVRREFFGATP